MTDFSKGQIGNYRLIHQLGRGGFAEVYLGEHIHLGTRAAIKILTTRLTGEQIERFRTEARMIANLEHPNIVRVLDFGLSSGSVPFLVMQYASNGTLRSLHPKKTILPLPSVLTYVQQVASALQFAHSQQLIHCDVKPENMLLGPQREVLLSDFGIAVVAQETRQRRLEEIAGTVLYMAPEQLRGMPDFATDQYALAVVAYEWLCGSPPFVGQAYLEVAYQHEHTPPPPLHTKIPIAPSIEAVILTALEKDPKERFASMSAFAKALERAVKLSFFENISDTYVIQRESTNKPASSEEKDSNEPKQTSDIFQEERPRSSRRGVLFSLAAGTIAAGAGFFAGTLSPFSTTKEAAATPPAPVAVGTVLTEYKGQSKDGTVYDVAWSPDGTRVASVNTDKTVHVWNAINGKFLLSYTGHSAAVTAIAWSSRGDYVATGGDDSTVQVWNPRTGELITKYTGHSDHVQSVSWSPDGKTLASSSADRTVRVWETSTGNDVLAPYANHQKTVWRVAWSPNGRYIASASGDTTVQIWNASNGNLISIYTNHTGAVLTIAWSPNGLFLASGGDDSTVQIWNVATAARIYKYMQHTAAIHRISWHPHDSLIASANRDARGKEDRAVHVWDLIKDSLPRIYTGKSGVAWSPDGSSRLASTTDRESTIQIWKAF